MILDYHPKTKAFTLTVDRREADPSAIMRDHGLDLSTPLSQPDHAVLFTREPYAAVAFFEHATGEAKRELIQIQQQIEKSWKTSSTRHIDVPADKELSPFQVAGVDYVLSMGNALVGDQPGLGKTMQAIAVANEMQAERVLVLCPANIRLQWCERIRSWTTMRYPFTVYPVLHGRRGIHPTAEWTVISYDLARTEVIWRSLAKGRYDLLILDEAHYLKTIDARRTRTVFGGGHSPAAEALAGRSSRILALSGTPLPNRPREAYILARGLCWDSIDWMSEERFSERFNPSEQRETPDGKTYIDERSGRHYELQARLRANFMVRRLKRDVLPQLKVPFLDIVHVEETGPVKQALQAEKLLDIDPEDMTGLDMTVRGQVSTVRRQMGIAIAPLAADYVKMLLDGGEEKVVVFAWHIEVLDKLMQKLAAYHPLRIDGTTPPSRKPDIVAQFARPGNRVLIGNILSMGTGTDGLQEACQRGVAAEASWVSGDNEQMVDRLDRMGQQGQVLFDFLVAPGSYSEHVLGSSLRKRKVTHTALDQRLDDW
jgi:SWI/SNF-related matrix-associated actin-dependent regulator of chromatin subfamily A-like protein 1